MKDFLQVAAPIASLLVTLLLLLRQSGHKEGADDAELAALRHRVDEMKADWIDKSEVWHKRFNELQRWHASLERIVIERVEAHYMPRREAEALISEMRRGIEDLREWRARWREK